MIMVFALGISIPDSRIVVHTSTLIFPWIKSSIISSSSLPDIFPWANPTFASGTIVSIS